MILSNSTETSHLSYSFSYIVCMSRGHVSVEARGWHRFPLLHLTLLSFSFLFFLRQGLWSNLELTNLARLLLLASTCLHSSGIGVRGMCKYSQSFLIWVLGIEVKSPCFQSKEFSDWAYALFPYLPQQKKMKFNLVTSRRASHREWNQSKKWGWERGNREWIYFRQQSWRDRLI